MSRRTLNISLTPELERLIASKVETGRYLSASEVVRDGLRLLEERDDRRHQVLDRVRAKVDAGLASLDRGEGVSGEEVFARLEARIDELERATRNR